MKPMRSLLLMLLIIPVVSAGCEDVVVCLKVGGASYLAPGALCPVAVPAGSNGGDVLDAAVALGCITSWDSQPFAGYGRFVTCINGLCGHNAGDFVPELQDQDGTYWEFSVNTHTTSYGIDGYGASNLDVVGFTYQDWFLGFADFTVSESLP